MKIIDVIKTFKGVESEIEDYDISVYEHVLFDVYESLETQTYLQLIPIINDEIKERIEND